MRGRDIDEVVTGEVCVGTGASDLAMLLAARKTSQWGTTLWPNVWTLRGDGSLRNDYYLTMLWLETGGDDD